MSLQNTKDQGKQLKQKLIQNANELTVLSVEDLLIEWSMKTGKSIESISRSAHVNMGSAGDCPGCHDRPRSNRPNLNSAPNPATSVQPQFSKQASLELTKKLAGFYAPALDLLTLNRLIQELGISAKMVQKTISGRPVVILKNLAGKGQIFKNAAYLADKPKVVGMAIGRIGIDRAIAGGARITFFLYVPINFVSAIMDDRSTLAVFLGTMATDLVKIGIGALVASFVAKGAVAAGLTVGVAGPFAIAIFAGVAAALILDELDARYGITDKLIDKLAAIEDATIGEFGRKMWELERILNWQIDNNIPPGRGIFF